MTVEPDPTATTAPRPEAPARRSVSVVIPVYNGRTWLRPTLQHLSVALDRAGWNDSQVVVVDDGSTDGTAEELAQLAREQPVTVVSQENQGRFLARLHGLEAATGDDVLLIDIRVHLDPDSLRFLRERREAAPGRRVWNGHVRTATSWRPWTRFWNPITFLAWHRYLGHPTDTSFGIEDYDHFPKGTGFFFAPRQDLLELCANFDTTFGDVSMASDDTLLIRPLAERERINIAPELGGVYYPRDDFSSFLRHSYFRGTTFVDGHLRAGSRFHRPFWAAVALAPIPVSFLVLRPRLALRLAGATMVATPLAARTRGVPLADGVSFTVLLPVFAAAYGAGIARGLRLQRAR